jgi:uncharacterized membrane protein
MAIIKILYYILMFLPLVITLVALPFLPDQIPAHYGYDNQVTRWGSKYETLIFPAITILMGYFLLAMSKVAAKQEASGKNNENAVIITGIASLILFNIMTCYFLYTGFNRIENLSSVSLDINQLLFAILGAIMIFIGSIMPKLRMNFVIGLRTPWSLKNEITWKKSQRFGGISFIIAGSVIILICLFTGGWQCFVWTMGVMLITVIIDIIYTYKISKMH